MIYYKVSNSDKDNSSLKLPMNRIVRLAAWLP